MNKIQDLKAAIASKHKALDINRGHLRLAELEFERLQQDVAKLNNQKDADTFMQNELRKALHRKKAEYEHFIKEADKLRSERDALIQKKEQLEKQLELLKKLQHV